MRRVAVTKEEIIRYAERLQQEWAAARRARPGRQQRSLDAPIRSGWRVLPRTHAKYDGEMGFSWTARFTPRGVARQSIGLTDPPLPRL